MSTCPNYFPPSSSAFGVKGLLLAKCLSSSTYNLYLWDERGTGYTWFCIWFLKENPDTALGNKQNPECEDMRQM